MHSRYLVAVLNVRKVNFIGCQSAGTKGVGSLMRLLAGKGNAVLAYREDDVRIQVIRLHGQQLFPGDRGEANRSKHDLCLQV